MGRLLPDACMGLASAKAAGIRITLVGKWVSGPCGHPTTPQRAELSRANHRKESHFLVIQVGPRDAHSVLLMPLFSLFSQGAEMLVKFICSRGQRYLLTSLTPDKEGWGLFLGQRKDFLNVYYVPGTVRNYNNETFI